MNKTFLAWINDKTLFLTETSLWIFQNNQELKNLLRKNKLNKLLITKMYKTSTVLTLNYVILKVVLSSMLNEDLGSGYKELKNCKTIFGDL